MSKAGFDDLTDFYDALIDWPKRLANEAPFYRHWFGKIGVRRVVDVACGTGRHAAMFHEGGLTVEGADLSSTMIARARTNFGENESLRWAVRGFDQPILSDGDNIQPFDAALCVGNSLALAPDVETVERAIRQMFAAIRPGGIAIVQVLNLWQLPDGPCVWQKCKKVSSSLPLGDEPGARAESPDVLILKGVHRSGSRGFVEFLAASLAEGKLLYRETVEFLGLEASQLERYARAAGAKVSHFFGDYKQHPYKPEKSADLMMVAEKDA
jgi:SAM-dependent methyltransferase